MDTYTELTVCIITCHDVYNAGASLQAHALRAFIEQQGVRALTIDYKPDYLSRHFLLWGCFSDKYDKPIIRTLYNLVKLPGRIVRRLSRRKKQYDLFSSKWLKLSTKRYSTLKQLTQNPPKADVYFTGSDQVWNTLFPNGKDPAFYLSFVPEGSIRASYAASFATETVSPDCRDNVKEWLQNLDFISVRESSGLNILRELGINGGSQVLDPVFLLSKEKWEAIEDTFHANAPYILLYDFDNSEGVKTFAINKAKLNGWKIYSILPCKYADCVFEDCGPAMLPTLIHHASFIISNSFHATAFSLIYEKDFVVFNRNESINTRMQDLLSLIGEDAMQETRDYTTIRPKLQTALNHSIQYISNVLNKASERREK